MLNANTYKALHAELLRIGRRITRQHQAGRGATPQCREDQEDFDAIQALLLHHAKRCKGE